MRVISGNYSRYKLDDLVTLKEKMFHTSDMKPFVFDPALIDHLDVARRDHMEFFVETVLGHKGDKISRPSSEFW